MKVLLINTVNLEKNGISTFILNSAKVLVNQGAEVTIVAPNKVSKIISNNLLNENVKLVEIHNRMKKPIRYFLKLKQLISKNKYDIVHINGNSTTMTLELLASKIAGTKVRIAHSHNTITEHPVINKLLRPLFELCVTERFACNEAAGKWLFHNQKFYIILNGIDLDSYGYNLDTRKKYRKILNLDDNEILLGHIGEFNHQKNQEFLISLISKLDYKYKLVLVGDGPNCSNIKKIVKSKKLDDKVIFTGNINNVNDYLMAMDIFVLPSRFEGQPFVLIEAMATGLPIIVSNFVSKEVNVNNKIEFLNLDTLQWVQKIKKLIKSDRFRDSQESKEKLSEEGYSIVKNGSIMYKYYCSFYEQKEKNNE